MDIKGAGDFVASLTTLMGIKPCAMCKQRQQWLNQNVPWPYKITTPIQPPTSPDDTQLRLTRKEPS